MNEGNDMETVIATKDKPEDSHQFKTLLDEHSIIQCRQYAKERFPNDIPKQEELIKDIQNKYYESYLEEVIPIQLINQKEQIEKIKLIQEKAKETPEILETFPNIDFVRDTIPKSLTPAQVWTHENIMEFKKQITVNMSECKINISSLATATVRVPTHHKGKKILWEFATDHYDLGFGLFFEWNLHPNDNITVTMDESSDEEDEEEDDEANPDNIESGPQQPSINNDYATEPSVGLITGRKKEPKDLEGCSQRQLTKRNGDPILPIDELIPVLRRNCHELVYSGSHNYPGIGNYLLKFDNSFSIIRSKWLYYRVCYAD